MTVTDSQQVVPTSEYDIVIASFEGFVRNVRGNLPMCLILTQFLQTFLTNHSKLKIYLCECNHIVITETLS
jgi:hypothetical protein